MMELAQKSVGTIVVVTPAESRIDARSAPALKDQLHALIEAGNTRIVLNLAEVNFVDSSGLGAIVSGVKALGGRGALAVCGAREAVQSLFKLTRLDKVVRLCGTEEEAVAALGR